MSKRWTRWILPFVAVLIAVAVVFAMAINAELDAPATADALDVDVEIAPVLAGEVESFLQDTDYTMHDSEAAKVVGTRCICPHCGSQEANYTLVQYLERESARAALGASIGGEGAGVHAVPALKGAGVGNYSRISWTTAPLLTATLHEAIAVRG